MKEFYFPRYYPGDKGKLWRTIFENNTWNKPEIVPFIEEYSGVESCFSPDGNKFFYVHIDLKSEDFAHDIYVVEKNKKSWGIPGRLTNTDLGARRISPSVARSGSLYFSGDFDEPGQKDIYCSKLIQKRYSKPVNLGSPVNSWYHEEHVFVSPDESYILFDSYRPGEYGKSDIYVSFRKKDGTWGEAINLGPGINSGHYDWYPAVTPDGKYITFSRTLPDVNIDMYWVSSEIIEEIKQNEKK
jgi:Tol biopolymer transport system component